MGTVPVVLMQVNVMTREGGGVGLTNAKIKLYCFSKVRTFDEISAGALGRLGVHTRL